MKFGLLKDGVLTYAPKDIIVNNVKYMPGTDEAYRAAGYKEIVNTPYPSDGKQYSSYWELENDKIVQKWGEVPVEPKTPAQLREEAYQIKLCVVFPENSNELITIDAAVKLVGEYSCETTERAADIVAYLKKEITEQKEIIRKEFPDE